MGFDIIGGPNATLDRCIVSGNAGTAVNVRGRNYPEEGGPFGAYTANTLVRQCLLYGNGGNATYAAMSHDAEPDYGWMVMRGGDSGTYAVTYAMARGTGSTWSSPAWWQCFDRAGQRFSIAPDNTVFSMLGGEGSLLIIGMPTSDDAPAGYRLDPMNYRNRPHNWYTLVDWTMSRVADPHELRSAIRLDERLNMKQARFVDPVWAVNPPGWMLLTRQNLKGDKNDSSDIVLWDAVESAHHGIPSHAEVTANAVGVHDRAVGFWQRLPAEYSLGSHRGKVPFTVTFDDPRLSEERTWDFGDGSPRVKSKHPTHTYRRAGHFQVFAEAGAWAKPLKEHQQTGAPGLFRGKVMTLPPDPPAATAHVVDSTRLMIEFTEPMKAADATVTVDGDAATWALVDSGRRMTVQTSGKLKVQGRVALKGFTDRAQKPSGLAKETIDYAMPSWPSNPDRVVFRWEDVNAHNAVALPVGEVRRVELFRDGPRTGFDTLGRMDLGTGGMRGNLSASTRLGDGDLGEIVLGNAFSFECTFQPKTLLHHELRRPPRIVALSSHRPYVSLFMIGQQADRLLVSIKTIDNWMEDMGEPQEYMPVAPEKRKGSGAHPYGHGPWIEVAQLKDLEAHHLVVTYRPGEMIVYLDGREAFRTDRVTGDLDWGMGWMMFGTHHGLSGGSQSWHGSLEGVALYSRVLDAKEVARNAEVYAKKTKTRRREIEAAK